jgi:hypothetical protein
MLLPIASSWSLYEDVRSYVDTRDPYCLLAAVQIYLYNSSLAFLLIRYYTHGTSISAYFWYRYRYVAAVGRVVPMQVISLSEQLYPVLRIRIRDPVPF